MKNEAMYKLAVCMSRTEKTNGLNPFHSGLCVSKAPCQQDGKCYQFVYNWVNVTPNISKKGKTSLRRSKLVSVRFQYKFALSSSCRI